MGVREVDAMRYARRIDPGQPEIVDALRRCGAVVASWGMEGAPDLVVGFRGRVHLLEVKEPIGVKGGTSRRGQHLTDAQLEFHRLWQEYVTVVRSPNEALQAIGAVR